MVHEGLRCYRQRFIDLRPTNAIIKTRRVEDWDMERWPGWYGGAKSSKPQNRLLPKGFAKHGRGHRSLPGKRDPGHLHISYLMKIKESICHKNYR